MTTSVESSTENPASEGDRSQLVAENGPNLYDAYLAIMHKDANDLEYQALLQAHTNSLKTKIRTQFFDDYHRYPTAEELEQLLQNYENDAWWSE